MVDRTRAVNNGHVGLVSSKILGPTSLAAGEVTLAEEILDGVVIGDQSEVLAALKVMAENLDGVNSSKEFLFVDGVIPFSCSEFPGFVADRLGPVALVL